MKLKVLALATVTAVTLFPGIAQAVQWVKIAESVEGVSLYLDTHSVKRRGNTVQYWEQVVFNVPNEDGIISNKFFESLNCSNGTSKVMRAISYDKAGQLISDRPVNDSPVFSTIPGSIGESLFKRVCRK